MSIEPADSDTTSVLTPVYRTVTPGYRSHEDTGMDVIGWLILLGVLALLFPLLPLFLVLVIAGKIRSAVRSQTD